MQKNQREIKRIHEEIKEDYAFAVKKSVVDFVLKEPEIDEDERFLDEVFNFFYFFINSNIFCQGRRDSDDNRACRCLRGLEEVVQKLKEVIFLFPLFVCKRSFICHFQASHTPPPPDKPVYAPGTGGGGQLDMRIIILSYEDHHSKNQIVVKNLRIVAQ